MFKYIAMVLMVVLTSCYYFPFEFQALPGVNTKMALAAMSLPLIVVQMARGNIRSMRKDFVQLLYKITHLLSVFMQSLNKS